MAFEPKDAVDFMHLEDGMIKNLLSSQTIAREIAALTNTAIGEYAYSIWNYHETNEQELSFRPLYTSEIILRYSKFDLMRSLNDFSKKIISPALKKHLVNINGI